MNAACPPPGKRPATAVWRRGSLAAREEPAAAGLLVVKVGGSLLSRRGWPELLRGLVSAGAGRPLCLVVGGGAVVDGLRAIDRTGSLPPELMHALAIDGMRLTARVVSTSADLPLVPAPPGSGAAVLDVPNWLAAAGSGVSVPAGWQVTSDSLAARVAAVHGGGLLLAKSAPPPPCPAGVEPLMAAAAAGWVDDYFPTAARGLDELLWAAPELPGPAGEPGSGMVRSSHRDGR